MDLKDRREFLKVCAASVPGLVFANGLYAENTKGGRTPS